MKTHALTTAMRNAGQIWLNHLSSSHAGSGNYRSKHVTVGMVNLGETCWDPVFRQRRQIFKIQGHQIRWDEDLQIPGRNVGEM